MKSMHAFFSSSVISTSNSTGNSLDEIHMMALPPEPPPPPPEPPHPLLEPRRLPSSQFKGVVPQPNGRWGAQIYEKHQRVWLGTFNSEADAARAYDVAAQRFRGRDAATNFAPLPSSSPELRFIHSHSKAEIVDMLRKHTYHDELLQGLHTCRSAPWGMGAGGAGSAPPQREHLFDKAVTPSDVGKLNRLVIPKQHAEKHFPSPGGTGDGKGVLLNLEDARGKVWRFRYSYWNSSQSYVLTKGWSRYVKEMGLKAGDIVTFHRSLGANTQLYIDWRAGGDGNESASSSAGGGAYGSRQLGAKIKTWMQLEVKIGIKEEKDVHLQNNYGGHEE